MCGFGKTLIAPQLSSQETSSEIQLAKLSLLFTKFAPIGSCAVLQEYKNKLKLLEKGLDFREQALAAPCSQDYGIALA